MADGRGQAGRVTREAHVGRQHGSGYDNTEGLEPGDTRGACRLTFGLNVPSLVDVDLVAGKDTSGRSSTCDVDSVVWEHGSDKILSSTVQIMSHVASLLEEN
jgi:hypothetical protein